MIVVLALAVLFQAQPVKVSVPADHDPKPPFTGLDYVDIEVLARGYQVTWTSDAATGREILRGPGVTLVVAPSLQTALVNGLPEKLKRPVLVANGRVSVPVELARFVDGTAKPRPTEIARPDKSPKNATPKTQVVGRVVVDAGHGGKDSGTIGRGGLMEKDINLDVALRLRALLKEMGVDVVMTRADDSYPELGERTALSNSVMADLFVSIHTNSSENPATRGTEVWVPKETKNAARIRKCRSFAAEVLTEFASTTGDEGLGTKNWKSLRVLRETRCTAVLVELEYITNPQGERMLASPTCRQQWAQALAEAIRKYLQK